MERGAVCALLGPNGAGKSTTMRILFGQVKADSGTAAVLGHHCWTESSQTRRLIGWVNADTRYPAWLTGERALTIRCRMFPPGAERKGRELAERLQLNLNKPIRQLSRGNHQKVALMLALATSPSLLLLDEPSSGLDPLLQETFFAIVAEEKARGTTILLSSHTFQEVERLCETVALVKDGKVVAKNTLASFRSKARRRVTLHFQDSSPEFYPEGFEIQSEHTGRVVGFWLGELAPLLEFVNSQKLLDLEITAPLLDDAFLEHYV